MSAILFSLRSMLLSTEAGGCDSLPYRGDSCCPGSFIVAGCPLAFPSKGLRNREGFEPVCLLRVNLFLIAV